MAKQGKTGYGSGWHAWHRRVTDPGERGLAPALCRAVLSVAATGYGLAARVRNVCYDRGWRAARRAAVPVISVGNITAGGTGKTPFVAWLARFLQRHQLRPAILSRGYGRDPRSGLDDENQMLHSLAPGVPIVVDPDRVRGAQEAVNRRGADVLVMDDGFQHRRLARDLDIVLVDAVDPFGGGRLLPRGLLREPLKGLERANLVVLTRTDLVPAGALQQIRGRVSEYALWAPGVLCVHRPTGLRCVAGGGHDLMPEALAEGRWAAFCGIGNPSGFRRTLEKLGAEIAEFVAFPDHHSYTDAELDVLLNSALEAGCRGVLTTEKDAIKVQRLLRGKGTVPVMALQVRVDITDGFPEVERQVLEAVASGR